MISFGIPAQELSGYRISPRSRVSALVGIMLLSTALVMLALWRGSGLADAPGQGGAGRGELTVFELPAAEQSVSTPQHGGGKQAQAAPAPGTAADQVTETGAAGAGETDDAPGAAAFGVQLAGLLADDPLAGGGAADYAVILRRHVAAHISPPSVSGGRRYSGTVVVRFRVARDGRIVDARVLQAMSAPLDEAALATLWRSDPMPRVPLNLTAPLEVDVPIEFRMRG